MSKLIFFACISLSSIFLVNSNPTERNISDGVSVTSSDNLIDNKTEPHCSCTKNTTEILNNLSPTHIIPPIIHDAAWKCNYVGNNFMRDDYHHSHGIGSHKLHTRAKIWNEARKICIEEGGHLAIINSIAEANILLDLANRSGPIKGAVYTKQFLLGIHDLYAEGEWVTIKDESLAKSGYNAWTDKFGGQPDNGSGIQNCGAMLDDGKLDDVACNVPFAFFCEISHP